MEIKVGQWYRTRGGAIQKIVLDLREHSITCIYPLLAINSDGDQTTLSGEGRVYAGDDGNDHSPGDLVEHLPDCTGFGWVPKPTTRTVTFCKWIVWDKPEKMFVTWKMEGLVPPWEHAHKTNDTETHEVPL